MRYLLFLIIIFPSVAVFGHRNCGTEHVNQIQIKQFPEARERESEIERFALSFMKNRQSAKVGEDIEVYIPIVFHVLWNKNEENIPDKNIYEQIDRLNKDFNAVNEDLNKVPTPFKKFIGNVKVKFVLANRDPLGNVTTGINRKRTEKEYFSVDSNAIKNPASGGVGVWSPNEYLNIWVGNIRSESLGEILGYAAFPMYAGTSIDGVVLNYRHVGITDFEESYNLGRTATHEVGHYLGLRHIWGDEESCDADDGIEDTPRQYTKSRGTPSFPFPDQCTKGNGIMFMNYMDYSDDKALLMFTIDQSLRMQSVLNGARKSLVFSRGYVPPVGKDIAMLNILSPKDVLCEGLFTPSVKIISIGSDKIRAFDVSYQIENGPVVTKSWNGSMDLYETVDYTFEPVYLDSGSYAIRYWVSGTNDGIDENTNNDTIRKTFQVGVKNYLLPFQESFERSTFVNNGFSIVNPDGNITWKRSLYKQSKDGNYSLMMNNFEYDFYKYQVDFGQKDDLVLPYLDLSNNQQASLSFEISATQSEDLNTPGNGWDTLQVLVSTDCGSTYDVVYNKYNKELVTVPVQKTFFIPKANQWRKETINLNRYAGYKDVIIVFRNISYWENNIYIDDLQVTGKSATSVKSYELDHTIELFPNPSIGQVTLKFNELPDTKLKQVLWTNVLGQEVQSHIVNSSSPVMKFNLSGLARGMYIVRLLFDDGSVSSRKLLLE